VYDVVVIRLEQLTTVVWNEEEVVIHAPAEH
jgi:hypothetical protein